MSFETTRPQDELSEEIRINEIAYVWREEQRNQRYRELIGEDPKIHLSEEEIARRIVDPEYGKEEARRENLKADREGENLDYFQRKNS